MDGDDQEQQTPPDNVICLDLRRKEYQRRKAREEKAQRMYEALEAAVDAWLEFHLDL